MVNLFNKLGNDLGIGIGMKGSSLILQFLFQRRVVFNNAVVYQGDLPRLAGVRMRIDIIGRAVCCPASMAYAYGTRYRLSFQLLSEVGYFALAFFIPAES